MALGVSQVDTTADDLRTAVGELLDERRVKIIRDGMDATETAIVPSLWEQIVDAVGVGNEQGSGRVSTAWRLPVAVEVVDLRSDIVDMTVDGLYDFDKRPRMNGDNIDVPSSIRLLAATVATRNVERDITRWTLAAQSWGRRARTILGLDDDPQPRRIRDTPCPECGVVYVVKHDADGEAIHLPPLLVQFEGKLPRDIQCSACVRTWLRGEDFIQLFTTIHGPYETIPDELLDLGRR